MFEKTNYSGTTAVMEEPVKTREKVITVIPATKSLYPERDGVETSRKKRVAAYCRVSTMLEEQQGSYELQKKYYTEMIDRNPNWEPVGVYGDEGKSGTSLKGRTGFLMMMDDVRAGKIDYIITKATSRFGRNNKEFMEILDELDSYGVEVLFESEGIMTSGRQTRSMLQMMGVANEHYSSSLSNNIRWSNERNMKKGKVTFCYKHFLGYEKDEDGKPKIVEEEAKIVRMIYELFLEGKTYTFIASYLTKQGIPTPAGKTEWGAGTIKSILTNEKYSGDALLQKTFRRNYLDKHVYKNTGERPQVTVENDHPAIIDKATFSRVQDLVKARSKSKNHGTSESPFVGKIICADCGDYFGHKTWKSRGHITYTMWVCNSKYTDETAFSEDRCKSANIREEWIKQGYLYTMNQLLAARGEILAKYERKLRRIDHRLGKKGIKAELDKIEIEGHEVDQEIADLKDEWEFSFGKNNNYDEKRLTLSQKGKAMIEKTNALEAERKALNAEMKIIQTFIDAVKSMPDRLKRFNNKYFTDTIDCIEVDQLDITYRFYGGQSIKVKIDLLKKMCE